MVFDLSSMSRKDLEKLLDDVKKALLAAHARDKRDARKAAERAAAEFGFTLNELDESAQVKSKKTRTVREAAKPSVAKYADPADRSRTWTGKGRQPNWFRAAVEKGITPSDMEI